MRLGDCGLFAARFSLWPPVISSGMEGVLPGGSGGQRAEASSGSMARAPRAARCVGCIPGYELRCPSWITVCRSLFGISPLGFRVALAAQRVPMFHVAVGSWGILVSRFSSLLSPPDSPFVCTLRTTSMTWCPVLSRE